MTDMVYDYITTGVDLLINAVILAGIVILIRNSNILSQISTTQQANADRVNYYKEYAKYDCTAHLSTTDVLSAMSYYKNDHVIVAVIPGDNTSVIVQNGKWYTQTGTSVPQLSSRDGVENLLNITWTYSAYLFEDDWSGNGTMSVNGYQGGTISGIKFIKE